MTPQKERLALALSGIFDAYLDGIKMDDSIMGALETIGTVPKGFFIDPRSLEDCYVNHDYSFIERANAADEFAPFIMAINHMLQHLVFRYHEQLELEKNERRRAS